MFVIWGKKGGWYLKCIFYTFQTLWQVLHLINQTVITAIWNRKRQLSLRGVKLIIYAQQGLQWGRWSQSSALDTPEDCTRSSCLTNNWINTATVSTTVSANRNQSSREVPSLFYECGLQVRQLWMEEARSGGKACCFTIGIIFFYDANAIPLRFVTLQIHTDRAEHTFSL